MSEKAVTLLPQINLLDSEEKSYLIACLLTSADGQVEMGIAHTKSAIEISLQLIQKADFDTWLEIHWPPEVPKDCTKPLDEPDCVEQSILARHACPSCQKYIELRNRWEIKQGTATAAVPEPPL